MHRFFVLACIALTAALSACSTTRQAPDTSIKTSSVIVPEEHKLAYARDEAVPRMTGWHHLAGRTLEVSSLADLKLQDKEVILSFDDGPIPGRTDKVLAILDQFGVKGAFMMVGAMAEMHPALARKVAMDGNTIGSHTYDHADLSSLSFDAAMAEVIKGQLAVTKETGSDVSFFRFPYLSESHRLACRDRHARHGGHGCRHRQQGLFRHDAGLRHAADNGPVAQARPRHHSHA